MADEAVDGGDPNDDGEAANDATAGAEGTNAANTGGRSSNQDKGVMDAASAGNQARMVDYGIPPGYAQTYADTYGVTIDEAVQSIVDSRHEHNPTASQTAMNAQLDKAFGAKNPGVTGLMDVAMTAFGALPGFGAVSAIGNLTNRAEGRPTVGFGISDIPGADKTGVPSVADKARAGITDVARSGVTGIGSVLGDVDRSLSEAVGSTPSASDSSRTGEPTAGGDSSTTANPDPLVAQNPTTNVPAIVTPTLTQSALDTSYDSVINTWRRILGDNAFGASSTLRRTV